MKVEQREERMKQNRKNGANACIYMYKYIYIYNGKIEKDLYLHVVIPCLYTME